MFFDQLHWEKERVVLDSAMESTSLLAATTSKLNGLSLILGYLIGSLRSNLRGSFPENFLGVNKRIHSI